MLSGLLAGGLWEMLAAGGLMVGVLAVLRAIFSGTIERLAARATPARRVPPAVTALARAAGLDRLQVWLLPSTVPRRAFTTSWMHRRPAVFISERWIGANGDLIPEAVGAVAHEVAHVQGRDVLIKLLAQLAAVFCISLSGVSLLGAAWPPVLANLSVAELGALVAVPLVSWLAATWYPSLMRRLELRADARAMTLCGAAALERSIRVLADDSRGWLLSTHPSSFERLRQVRQHAAISPPVVGPSRRPA